MDYIENRIFDDIAIGESAEIQRTLFAEDIEMFAAVSGDLNPAHMDPEYAEHSMFHHIIAHGMWGGALISAVLGTRLPGPGTIYLGQSLHFRRPVSVGDTITTRVTVTEKMPDTHRMKLQCQCVNQHGEKVIIGEAEVIAPKEKICRPKARLPQFISTSEVPKDV